MSEGGKIFLGVIGGLLIGALWGFVLGNSNSANQEQNEKFNVLSTINRTAGQVDVLTKLCPALLERVATTPVPTKEKTP